MTLSGSTSAADTYTALNQQVSGSQTSPTPKDKSPAAKSKPAEAPITADSFAKLVRCSYMPSLKAQSAEDMLTVAHRARAAVRKGTREYNPQDLKGNPSNDPKEAQKLDDLDALNKAAQKADKTDNSDKQVIISKGQDALNAQQSGELAGVTQSADQQKSGSNSGVTETESPANPLDPAATTASSATGSVVADNPDAVSGFALAATGTPGAAAALLATTARAVDNAREGTRFYDQRDATDQNGTPRVTLWAMTLSDLRNQAELYGPQSATALAERRERLFQLGVR